MMEDKRTTFIDFYGKKYPLCLTVSAQERIKEQYGGVNEMLAVIKKGGPNLGKVYAGFLYHMMRGGNDRARSLAWMEGRECDAPEVPNLEVLECLLTNADINELQDSLFEALAGSSRRTVETEPGKEKNAETTQESS